MGSFSFDILCIVLAFSCLTDVSGSTVCLSCKGIAKPDMCTMIEHCGSHSTCFTEQYITAQGFIRHDLGCRDTVQCPTGGVHFLVGRSLQNTSQSSSVFTSSRHRRQSIMCKECCTGNLCNAAGCKNTGYPVLHGEFCYACASNKYPDRCNYIQMCGRDEACYIRRYKYGVDTLYSTGCLSKTKCLMNGLLKVTLFGRDVHNQPQLPHTVSINRTNRATTLAEHCCGSFLCNNKLPVNGGWSSWSNWGHCSQTCGGVGYRSRTRKCNNPVPVHGGKTCVGVKVDYDQSCSQAPCPNDLVCLSCNAAARPRDCNRVEKCGPHSVCFLEHYVTPNGYSLFFSGCRDKTACGNRTHGKRFFNGLGNRLCSECCTGNLCNSAGCKLPGYPNGIGPICYACQQQLNPYQCDTIDICNPGQVCSIGRLSRIDTIYHSGCANKSTCHSDGSCPSCCDTNLCNNNACKISMTTNTPIQSSPLTVSATTHTPTHHSASTGHPTHHSTTTHRPTHHPTQASSHWGSWTTWTACSATCGSGLTMRNRTCIKNSNSACSGDYMDLQTCQIANCIVPSKPLDGGWSHWEPWGSCNEPENIGTHTRYRYCDSPFPGPGGKNCTGATSFIDIDTQYCLGIQSPTCIKTAITNISVDGNWTLGSTVLLHCKASGSPRPEITWKTHTANCRKMKVTVACSFCILLIYVHYAEAESLRVLEAHNNIDEALDRFSTNVLADRFLSDPDHTSGTGDKRGFWDKREYGESPSSDRVMPIDKISYPKLSLLLRQKSTYPMTHLRNPYYVKRTMFDKRGFWNKRDGRLAEAMADESYSNIFN